MAVAVDDPGLAAAERWRRRAFHGVFSVAARVSHYTSDIRAARAQVEVIRDLAYGPHPVAHRVDVYRPRLAPRPLPVLIYMHGGAFTLCSKDTHAGIALLNAQHAGYLVFNINYRLAPHYRFPAAVEDACQAFRWVAANAHRHGGDPERIVLAGESAGANLALGVAIATAYKRPEPYAREVFESRLRPLGVMPITPYLQVSNPLRHALHPGAGYWAVRLTQDIARIYLGTDGAQPTATTLMADPIRVLEECGAPLREFPEVFSAVGTADICHADVRRLEEVCARHALPFTGHYFQDEIHAFHALRWWRQAARDFWRASVGFLRRVGAG